MKKLFLILLVFIVFPLLTLPLSNRYNTYANGDNGKLLQDRANWEKFYSDLKQIGELYRDSLFFIWGERATSYSGKDELEYHSTIYGYEFVYRSSGYNTKITMAIYLPFGNYTSVPFSAKPFNSFNDAVEYWNKLMNEYGGSLYDLD